MIYKESNGRELCAGTHGKKARSAWQRELYPIESGLQLARCKRKGFIVMESDYKELIDSFNSVRASGIA